MKDAELTVDIYDMGDAAHAAAMYAAERPPDCRSVAIGSGGYVDQGVLNFHHARYYAKLMAFSEAADPAPLLEAAARAIAARMARRAARAEHCGAGALACDAALSGIRRAQARLGGD